MCTRSPLAENDGHAPGQRASSRIRSLGRSWPSARGSPEPRTAGPCRRTARKGVSPSQANGTQQTPCDARAHLVVGFGVPPALMKPLEELETSRRGSCVHRREAFRVRAGGVGPSSKQSPDLLVLVVHRRIAQALVQLIALCRNYTYGTAACDRVQWNAPRQHMIATGTVQRRTGIVLRSTGPDAAAARAAA